MFRRKMTKKKIMDLVAYSTLLIHNNKIDGVMTTEQLEEMIKLMKKKFKDNEDDALDFIKNNVLNLTKELDNELGKSQIK